MAFTPSEDKSFLDRLTEITETRLSDERFGVSELAREMGMSRSNLHRKLRAAANKSISQYIRELRLERATELLKQGSSTVSQIAFEVGFGSVSYFIKCFHDHYGFPPGELRKDESAYIQAGELQLTPEKTSFRGRRVSLTFLISIISLITIAAILVILFEPFGEKDPPPEKSIAVLPFINDSPEETEMYFINGTMEAILNNLCKIEDLRVVSRNSVEQYRTNPKPTAVVAEEMNVSYILEGSGIKQGDQIFLTLQLIDARDDRHIWSESYQKKTKEVFELYSEVSQLVANEIEAIVTPEEKLRIEKIPTKSQTAYDLYLRGMEEVLNGGYLYLSINMTSLQKSEELFRLTLQYDPTFAEAYAQIAAVYGDKYMWEAEPSSSYLDTISLYVEKALSYNDQLAEAYVARGWYHRRIGQTNTALEDFKTALELDPNNLDALNGAAWMYLSSNDIQGAIEYYHKVELINRGPLLSETIDMLSHAYFLIGCYDKSMELKKQWLSLSGDTVEYYSDLALCEYFIRNNTHEAIKYLKKGLAIDPDDSRTLGSLSEIYFDLGRYGEALWYVEKKMANLLATNQADIYQAFLAGFIYQKNGNTEQANYYFDQQIEYGTVRLKSENILNMQLAFAYNGLGETDKVYKSLRVFNQSGGSSVYILRNMQDNHFFESIQDEPEFQKIRQELIAKYHKQRERVINWLEENDRL